MTQHIVLGYPYDGGLYYLLSRQNASGPPSRAGHPYYEQLYGGDPVANQIWATNLAVLFDEILLPTADEYLPEHWLYTSGDSYFNPHIRLRVDHTWDFKRDAHEMARRLLEDDSVVEVLIGADLVQHQGAAEFLITSIIEQLRLALENNAVLVAGDGVAAVVDQVFRRVVTEIAPEGSTAQTPRTLTITPRTLRLIGLDWHCDTFDSFVGIRESKDITDYGVGCRKALASIKNTDDLQNEFIGLLRRAMDSAEVASRVKGAFEVTGVGSNIASAVPVAGSIATLIGLGAYLGANAAQRRQKEDEWYLIGSKLREVALKNLLRRDQPR